VSWRLLFLIFILLQLGDFVSTKLVLDISGPFAEVNPIAQWLIITIGIYAILPLKAIACWAIWKWKYWANVKVLAIVNTVFVMIVAGNFYNYYNLIQEKII